MRAALKTPNAPEVDDLLLVLQQVEEGPLRRYLTNIAESLSARRWLDAAGEFRLVGECLLHMLLSQQESTNAAWAREVKKDLDAGRYVKVTAELRDREVLRTDVAIRFTTLQAWASPRHHHNTAPVVYTEADLQRLLGTLLDLLDDVFSILDRGPSLRGASRPSRANRGGDRSGASALPLPRRNDSFVGRHRELDELRGHLLAGERLVTIWGAGGIGKTRLALELLAGVGCELAHQLVFVDVSRARTVEEFVVAFAEALKATVDLAKPIASNLAQIAAVLRALGSVLAVLDNFEQLPREGVEALASLLDHTTSTMFVVTSREILRLPDERSLELSPLGTEPDDGVGESDAVKLLEARATALQVHFSESEMEDCRALVRTLEGLPLAIELAASRLRTLSVRDLTERIAKSFRVLASRSPGLPSRHLTITATLQWSWSLLEPHERAAWAQCSAFANPFPVELAECVVDLSGFPGAPEVLDAIQSLREKSILVERTSTAGTTRLLGMFTMVKEFASARLAEAGTEAQVYERHARCFGQRAAPIAARFEATGERVLFDALCDDTNELAAVVERLPYVRARDWASDVIGAICGLALKQGEPWTASGFADRACDTIATAERFGVDDATIARALEVLGRTQTLIARHAEATENLRRARAIADASGDAVTKARCTQGLARLAYLMGRASEAVAFLESPEVATHAVEHRRLRAERACFLAPALRDQGDLDGALRAATESIRLYRSMGDDLGEASVSSSAAVLYDDLGDVDACVRMLQHVIDLDPRRKSPFAHVSALGNIGRALNVKGDYQRARSTLHEAMRCAHLCGSTRIEAMCLGHLAVALFMTGCEEDGVDALKRSVERLTALRDRRVASVYLGDLGVLQLLRGDLGAGEQHIEDAVRELREVNDPRQLSRFLSYSAASLARQGRVTAAEDLLAEAAALVRGSRDPHRRAIPEVQRAHIELAKVRVDGLGSNADPVGQIVSRARRRVLDGDHWDKSLDLRTALRYIELAAARSE